MKTLLSKHFHINKVFLLLLSILCIGFATSTFAHDDEAQLWVNSTLVWDHIACCDDHYEVWQGILDANYSMAFQVTEGSGGSTGTVLFNAQPSRLYVDSSMASSGNGYTWTNAFKTLQEALNVAKLDTVIKEIWVAKGTYYPTVDVSGNTPLSDHRTKTFKMLPHVKIYGGFAGNETALTDRTPSVIAANISILSGDIGVVGVTSDNAYHVFYNNYSSTNPLTNTAMLDGFTISDGNANPIGGAGNSEKEGAAFYNTYASPTITNCVIKNNYAVRNGKAVLNTRSTPSFINCVFTNITGANEGDGVIFDNDQSGSELTNCTITGNASNGILSNFLNSSTKLKNCIVWGNTPSTFGNSSTSGSTLTISNCIIQGGCPSVSGISCTNVINQNPYFISSTDLRLQICSPAINVGDNTGLISTDITGNTRIFNSFVDLGAYERQDSLLNPSNYGNNVWQVHTWNKGGSQSSGGTSWNTDYSGYYIDTNFNFNSTTYWSSSTSPFAASNYIGCHVGNDNHSWSAKRKGFPYGNYVLHVRAHDDEAQLWINGIMVWNHVGCCDVHTNVWQGVLGANDSIEFRATDGTGGANGQLVFIDPNTPSRLYVDSSMASSGNGYTWATAFKTLQEALDVAKLDLAINEIWVAKGTYYPTAGAGGNTNPGNPRDKTFVMLPFVGIYGGFVSGDSILSQRNWTSNVTILSGDIDGIPDTVSGSGATLSITGNGGNSYHVIYNDNNGLDSNAVLDGITITGGNANTNGAPNSAGGGIYNVSTSPKLSNLTFSGNCARGAGGGIYIISSSSNLTNIVISGNKAGSGGGMVIHQSSSNLTNIVISGNKAGSGGGMWNSSSSPNLTNIVISGNIAYTGGGIYNSNSSLNLTNIVISGNNANYGGGIYNDESNEVLKNCIFWNNKKGGNSNIAGADIENVAYNSDDPAVTNITNTLLQLINNTNHYPTTGDAKFIFPDTNNVLFAQNPLFVDATNPAGPDGIFMTADDGLRLSLCSPALNMGNNIGVASTDILGNSRIYNNIVDLGAYELQDSLLSPSVYGNNVWNVFAWNAGDNTSAAGVSWNTNYSGYYTDTNFNFNTETYWSDITSPSAAGNYVGCAVNNDLHSWSAKRKGFPTGYYILDVPAHDDEAQLWINGTMVWNHAGCCDSHALVWQGVLGANDSIEFRATDGILGSKGHLVFNSPPSRLYVDSSMANSGDGFTWPTAFKTLQEALALAKVATVVNEIWVAKGTYYPTADAGGNTNPGNPREKTFVMLPNVAIYGGFVSGDSLLSQRNWSAHKTILSGNIDGIPDTVSGSGATLSITGNGGNSYHVIYNDNNGLDSNAVLDGFTITGGNANTNGAPNSAGGGIYNVSTSPKLSNLTFSGNRAREAGGGIFIASSISNPNNMVFSGNEAIYGGGIYTSNYSTSNFNNIIFTGNNAIGGGGICIVGQSTNFNNIVFSGNNANYGGGIYNYYSSPNLTNIVISGNNANYGGGIYNDESNEVLKNCIFWNNKKGGNSNIAGADIEGLGFSFSPGISTITNTLLQLANNTSNYPTSGNAYFIFHDTNNILFAQNPLFVYATNPAGPDGIFMTADDGLRLKPCSPAINVGDTTGVTSADIIGNPRIVNGIVDLGAYEYQGNPYSSVTTMNASACDTYTWYSNTYTTSGMYTATFTSINGCDSVHILNLTIHYASTSVTNETANACYTWSANGATYTASGIYLHTYLNSSGCVHTDSLNLNLTPQVQLSIKAILSGPYNSSTGLMDDSLRVFGLLPLTEPYTNSPFNKLAIGGPSGETTSSTVLNVTGNNAIVDWIFIEIRSASDPSMVVLNKRALLQRDGDIVNLDGVSPLTLNLAGGMYYVAVKHRNHLGVMSAAALNLSQCLMNHFDFSTGSVYLNPALSNLPRRQVGAVYTLWGADANNNKNVKYYGINNDKDKILQVVGVSTINAIVSSVYRVEDVNLDGKVKFNNVNNDRVVILHNVGVNTPNNVIGQHTPN